ncbi:DUF4365 domain-containing protein [Rhizobium hidalgonense]|uniref:DUF4365 domain-containing protein n=1 Tax=Rhizobium hidalgonense TaxID=1538159 RepID=UPI00287254A5|nr:DUF4365 domain-containing protein [Rhizobium hidalgonense]MDR9807956.1 DUF4365 domain-containing protein [Rhizobium hidalgonense]
MAAADSHAYHPDMAKNITQNQLTGEIGEAAVRLRFLKIGFQFDVRSRLEAGIDAIAEVMLQGRPLAHMIAVQVKATKTGQHAGEDATGFHYLLRTEDLDYWRGSNLPVIIVLYREADDSFYWKEVPIGDAPAERRLNFSKKDDVLDESCVDRLAALTVPKAGFGYYVPPLGGGEEGLVNILPIALPKEVFVSTTPHSHAQAVAILLEDDEPARFDWVIKGSAFWSFHDPRKTVCRKIVDLDQVEAIDVEHLAYHEDEDERNTFAHLLRKTLQHQVRGELSWNKDRKLFYFRARAENTTRVFKYPSAKKNTEADVVNVARNKTDKERVEFVRHHAFVPRFESFFAEWFLVVEPTYFFTTNGFTPHTYPDALLSGKKRLDNSSALRGQVIMWHRFLASLEPKQDLFAAASEELRISFGEPPAIALPTRVPEDAWGSQRKTDDEDDDEDLLNWA